MRYEFFDFQHTLSDEERIAWIRSAYETILRRELEAMGRKSSRLLRFLAESDFYTVPCRHHLFAGGNAWHQLETLAFAYGPCPQDYEQVSDFAHWQPQWLECFPMSLAVAALLHDISNAGYGGERHVEYPQRIKSRHGRKSTYVLVDYLKFDLMFDENMAILHHEHKSEDELRLNTPNTEDFEMIWAMPLFHMIQHCDTLSTIVRMNEQELRSRVEPLLAQ